MTITRIFLQDYTYFDGASETTVFYVGFDLFNSFYIDRFLMTRSFFYVNQIIRSY